jgi:hypothetical protein
VGVTKLAEQAASPVLMGCTSAGAFQDWQLVRKGRREAAPKDLASKREQLAEYVATVTIEVPRLEREQLINEACGVALLEQGRLDEAIAAILICPPLLSGGC